MPLSNARLQFQGLYDGVGATTVTLSPAAVTAGTTGVASTIKVPGALVGDLVEISVNAPIGNLTLQGEVTSADTVTLKFANTTAGSITPPAAKQYTAIVYHYNAIATT